MREAYPVDFEEFWQAYPRRIAKKAAYRAYQKALKEGAEPEKILKCVKSYVEWLKPGNGWRPEPAHPTTWLNRGSYDDEYESSKSENKNEVSFKIHESIVKKLRATGMADDLIKRWFDDCVFSEDCRTIFFKSKFVLDWVITRYEDQVHRAFGSELTLRINPGLYLAAG